CQPVRVGREQLPCLLLLVIHAIARPSRGRRSSGTVVAGRPGRRPAVGGRARPPTYGQSLFGTQRSWVQIPPPRLDERGPARRASRRVRAPCLGCAGGWRGPVPPSTPASPGRCRSLVVAGPGPSPSASAPSR